MTGPRFASRFVIILVTDWAQKGQQMLLKAAEDYISYNIRQPYQLL